MDDLTVLDILEIVSIFWRNFSDKLQSILPLSPVVSSNFVELASPYMGYLNWAVPVGLMVDFMSALLASLGVYYGSKYALKRMGLI